MKHTKNKYSKGRTLTLAFPVNETDRAQESITLKDCKKGTTPFFLRL